MLLFVRCSKCGAKVEDEDVCMLGTHFPWTCPACGAENKPLHVHFETADVDVDEEL